MTDYQFHPEAEIEHLETVAYYESQQPGLGARCTSVILKVSWNRSASFR